MQQGEQIGLYRIEGLLGRGGMAEVYRVLNTGLNRHEALKLLPPQMTFDHEFVERFLREARTAAGLQHPSIATIYAVSTPDAPQPFFTMELIEGESVGDRLFRQKQLSLPEALPLLQQVASALDYAHAHGIIHRDIKPANILLTPHGQAKVVDFGIARAVQESSRLTQSGMIIGTPEYMSPEQAGSGQPVGPASDQYSLAIIAYEMLTGRTPFGGTAPGDSAPPSTMSILMRQTRDAPRPLREFAPPLPPITEQAVLAALNKNAAHRFPSCQAFVAAMAGQGAAASPPPPVGYAAAPPLPPPNRTPLYLGSGVAVLGVVLIAASLLRGGNGGGRPAAAPSAPAATASAAAPEPEATPETITVPDLAGLKETQARDVTQAKGLGLDVTVGSSDSVPPGQIISQDPEQGTQTEAGNKIRVRISTGPAYTSQPPTPAPPVFSSGGSSSPSVVVASGGRLTEADLAGKSAFDLDVLRNEPFARLGYRFKRADMRNYFSSFPWYHPVTDNQDALFRQLSPTDKYNATFISDYQKRHGMIKR